MGSVAKPVKSLEINFKSDKKYKDFTDFVNNPPEPSDHVKNLIKQYQKRNEDS